MGTFYSVKIANRDKKLVKISQLKQKIDERLNEINSSMSTYRDDSVISRFNQARKNEAIEIDADFEKVLQTSLHVSKITQGVFNIALDPLINMWGFDRLGRVEKNPSHTQIAKVLNKIDLNNLRVEKGKIIKLVDDFSINLSSIAKGFAVDEIAKLLEAEGFDNFLVEIGGEVFAQGKNLQGSRWLIGIENPQSPGELSEIIARVLLDKKSMASSGTYLNVFERDGRFYSHIIDPRNGSPVTHSLISVSVIANDCMTADALATSFLILGKEKSEEILKSLPGTAALFVTRNDGEISKSFSENFFQFMQHS